ncbi:hypothetical protein ES703_109283 [subsurface metagenome]
MEEMVKILLIDDEPKFAADLQTAFGAKPYQVVTAKSRRQAQKMVRQEKPDLIILGMIMPPGDDFRLYQWLKQNTDSRRLPLIVVEAPPEKQLTRGWRMDGGLWHDAENYFCRPIEPAYFCAHLNR